MGPRPENLRKRQQWLEKKKIKNRNYKKKKTKAKIGTPQKITNIYYITEKKENKKKCNKRDEKRKEWN